MAKENFPCEECQPPQFPEDKHGPTYDNDTPNNWLRGGGTGGACDKPDFDYQKKGK